MSRTKTIISHGERIKAPCPVCKRVQNAKVVCGLDESFKTDNVFALKNRKHLVIECLGCDTIFLGQQEVGTTNSLPGMVGSNNGTKEYSQWKFFPPPKWREPPRWFSIDFQIKYRTLSTLIQDTYDAANRQAFVLSAMGVRACFDVAGNILGISEEGSFSEKIEAMRRAGHISPREKSILQKLVDAGSAAAHRGWMPSQDDLALLLDALETFIHHSMILPQELDNLSSTVPKRHPLK